MSEVPFYYDSSGLDTTARLQLNFFYFCTWHADNFIKACLLCFMLVKQGNPTGDLYVIKHRDKHVFIVQHAHSNLQYYIIILRSRVHNTKVT